MAPISMPSATSRTPLSSSSASKSTTTEGRFPRFLNQSRLS